MEPDPNRKNAGKMAKQVAIAMQIPFSLVGAGFWGAGWAICSIIGCTRNSFLRSCWDFSALASGYAKS